MNVGDGELPSWYEHAACADPDIDDDIFFPERGTSLEPARRVCRECPVRMECLEHALDVPERFGVWGGLSERERRNIRRTRNAASRHRSEAARASLPEVVVSPTMSDEPVEVQRQCM